MSPGNRDSHECGALAHAERAIAKDRPGKLVVLFPSHPPLTPFDDRGERFSQWIFSTLRESRETITQLCAALCIGKNAPEETSSVSCLHTPNLQLPPHGHLLTFKIHLLPFLLFLFLSSTQAFCFGNEAYTQRKQASDHLSFKGWVPST